MDSVKTLNINDFNKSLIQVKENILMSVLNKVKMAKY